MVASTFEVNGTVKRWVAPQGHDAGLCFSLPPPEINTQNISSVWSIKGNSKGHTPEYKSRSRCAFVLLFMAATDNQSPECGKRVLRRVVLARHLTSELFCRSHKQQFHRALPHTESWSNRRAASSSVERRNATFCWKFYCVIQNESETQQIRFWARSWLIVSCLRQQISANRIKPCWSLISVVHDV